SDRIRCSRESRCFTDFSEAHLTHLISDLRQARFRSTNDSGVSRQEGAPIPSRSRPLPSKHVLDGPVKATRVADRLPWRELYEAHAAELAGYLLRLTGDREVASDLMQETFVVGMRDESALREP